MRPGGRDKMPGRSRMPAPSEAKTAARARQTPQDWLNETIALSMKEQCLRRLALMRSGDKALLDSVRALEKEREAKEQTASRNKSIQREPEPSQLVEDLDLDLDELGAIVIKQSWDRFEEPGDDERKPTEAITQRKSKVALVKSGDLNDKEKLLLLKQVAKLPGKRKTLPVTNDFARTICYRGCKGAGGMLA